MAKRMDNGITLNTIYNEDCLETMKRMPDNSIDAVITDPPYGYSFMGKDWDKAVPSVEIWQECLRVLKPGAFMCVMSAPRSDVQCTMISRLQEAGFRLDFTPIYWTYASGFPKAGNIGKLVDKRLGTYVEGKPTANARFNSGGDDGNYNHAKITREFNAQSDQAKALDGSYAGFQPKPAVEVVIVAMKPLSEKTYVDQALKNRKGITWLDDCRVPTDQPDCAKNTNRENAGGHRGNSSGATVQANPYGRFPANLLVSDDVLNGHSKYFDLDAWADTLPFLAVPKASKSEKNKGLDGFEEKMRSGANKMMGNAGVMKTGSDNDRTTHFKNHHPTVKPLKLMSYLITLFSREGDVVLDPFVGSGTTVVAAKMLNRIGIGIEREAEYAEIAKARLEAVKEDRQEPEYVEIIKKRLELNKKRLEAEL